MSGKFEPKIPVNLDTPKDDSISVEELSKAKGELPLHSYVTCVIEANHKGSNAVRS